MIKSLIERSIEYNKLPLHFCVSYEQTIAKVKIHVETDRFRIEKSVQQGGTISSKLYTTLIEFIFKEIELDNKGINVNEKKLNHLCFADDIVIISDPLDEINKVVTELSAAFLKA